MYYEVKYDGTVVLPLSPLGITRKDQAFVDGLKLVEARAVKSIDENVHDAHRQAQGVPQLCQRADASFSKILPSRKWS